MATGRGSRTTAGLLMIGSALAIVAACVPKGRPAPSPGVGLGQGWTASERDLWYTGSQGSRLIPERWLLALEEPESAGKFMAPAHFARFGYLPSDTSALPIGFAVDDQSDTKLTATKLRWFVGQKDRERWVGLNCAACHTSEVRYNGHVERVDGGPTLADFQGFTDTLLKALQRTRDDPAKWERFAAAVLGPRDGQPSRDGAENRQLLRDAFEQLVFHEETLDRYNATGSDYGHGRLDAVGHILNKVAFLTEAEPQMRGEPDAPVSYPFIWNANQHDFLQWNGIVPNSKVALGRGRNIDGGALVRNTSEVMGVFADVDVNHEFGKKGFPSSVDTENLIAMEIQLGRLMSPAWPAAFGTIDPAKRRHGERLFKQVCAGCHAPLARDDLATPIAAEMTPIWAPAGVNTDPWMACNAYSYRALGGVLTGSRIIFAPKDDPDIAEEDYTRAYLEAEAIGVLWAKKGPIVKRVVEIALGGKPRIRTVEGPPPPPPLPGARAPDQLSHDQRLALCMAKADEPDIPPSNDPAQEKRRKTQQTEKRLVSYKARPLNGIWATAPYLHNGSVRTLWDLLQPVEKRAKSFWVGNREFDPALVGFRDQQSPVGSRFSVEDGRGRPIHGNSNRGHDYGNARLDDQERLALIEYMKSL